MRKMARLGRLQHGTEGVPDTGTAHPESAIADMSHTIASAMIHAATTIGRAMPFFVAKGSAAGGRPAAAGTTTDRARQGKRGARGVTLIEILIAGAILAVALLAIANMFPTGYTNVTEAGRRTMSLTAARQILEDARSLPYDNVTALNGFDSTNPATLPVNQPERNIARRWRYALAGEGDGFTYIQAERDQWATLSTAVPLGGSVQVSVVAVSTCPTAPCPPNPVSASATLQQVTVTITFPARAGNMQLATLVTRM